VKKKKEQNYSLQEDEFLKSQPSSENKNPRRKQTIEEKR